MFLALSEHPRDRGTIVAEGGGKVSYFSCLNTSKSENKTGKTGQECLSACSRLCTQALIPIALEGTEAGKVKASHALAKIAAISNPEIAFPGERVSQLFLPLLGKGTWLPGEELTCPNEPFLSLG